MIGPVIMVDALNKEPNHRRRKAMEMVVITVSDQVHQHPPQRGPMYPRDPTRSDEEMIEPLFTSSKARILRIHYRVCI